MIRASDDFEVIGVDVSITEAEGKAVEEGAAVKTPVGLWKYTAKTAVPTGTAVRITVTASDRPGHTASKTETH
jgi:hypothetical protein